MRMAEAEYQHEGSKQDIPPKDSALEAMATVGLSDREAARRARFADASAMEWPGASSGRHTRHGRYPAASASAAVS